MDIRLTPAETADLLQVDLRTLETWRRRKQGPTYMKIGGRIYYPQVGVAAYLAARTVEARA